MTLSFLVKFKHKWHSTRVNITNSKLNLLKGVNTMRVKHETVCLGVTANKVSCINRHTCKHHKLQHKVNKNPQLYDVKNLKVVRAEDCMLNVYSDYVKGK